MSGAAQRSSPIEWSVASRALPGQAECGDLHVVQEFEGGVLVGAIDGLGHGGEATLAARTAAEELSRHAGEPVEQLLARTHEALRTTRGAVMSLASLDARAERLSWIAVGDVEAVLVRAGEDAREWIIGRGGVVGYQLPQLRPATLPLRRGDLLVFATDGIRDDFAGLLDAHRSPGELAGMILARSGKQTDDALVLVVRYLGPP